MQGSGTRIGHALPNALSAAKHCGVTTKAIMRVTSCCETCYGGYYQGLQKGELTKRFRKGLLGWLIRVCRLVVEFLGEPLNPKP